MIKNKKLFDQIKIFNYLMVLRYLVYFGIFFLFLQTLYIIFDIIGERPEELCEIGWKFDKNFSFPQGFSFTYIFYFWSRSYICKMSTEALLACVIFISFAYIFFKSIGDAVLPVQRPWLRDIGEVFIALAVIHWDTANYMFSISLFSFMPAFVLILFSETLYFWLLILFRRILIKYTFPNPIGNGMLIITIFLWIIVILVALGSTNKSIF